MIPCNESALLPKLAAAQKLWLFLDYDGTLADFAPTPEDILPDADLIALISRLADHRDIRVTIISGRRLAHIQALLPVPGIFIAGTYGLELQTVEGEIINRLDYAAVRPFLQALKEEWQQLLAGRSGFFLEDKGWTLAIHAKNASEPEAGWVLDHAREGAQARLAQKMGTLFRLQGGHRFLECGPKTADKKRTVEYLVSTWPWAGDPLLLYLGDDDKDEVAFAAVQARGGAVVAVGERLRQSAADCWLASPTAVRDWLQRVVEARDTTGS